MSEPLAPSLRRRTVDESGHVQRADDVMRDHTELDNLKDEIGRNLKGEAVMLPWKTGRPLRSAGMNEATGEPLTPLAALDLHATVPQHVQDSLAREFSRCATMDRVSEGLLDHSAAQGETITEQELWHEAEARRNSALPPTTHQLSDEEFRRQQDAQDAAWQAQSNPEESVP